MLPLQEHDVLLSSHQVSNLIPSTMNFFKKLFCGGRKEAATTDSDMKRYLIACLGNIGSEYVGTRHNAGFMVADTIAEAAGVKFESKRYGDVAIVKVKNVELILLKPSTYMNLSGVAVRYWMNHEKLPLEQLMVVVDDLALPFGSIRIRKQGSDAGHNGLKNIAAQLGTQAYARLRFGVGNGFPKGGQIDFVLGKFPAEEMEKMPEILKHAADAVKAYALSGIDFAMNHYNC
jgi:PTH1 family peptidyl-tRNA hydrolase